MEEDRDEKLSVGDLVFIEATGFTGWKGRRGVVEETLEDGKLLISVFPKSQKKQVSLDPSCLEKFSEIDLSSAPFFSTNKWDVCCHCGNQVKHETIRDCSRCMIVGYCSDKCQRMNWKEEHKHDCEILRRAKMRVKKEGVLPLTADQHTGEWMFMITEISTRLIEKGNYVAAERLLHDGIRQMPDHTGISTHVVSPTRELATHLASESCGFFYARLSRAVCQQGRHRLDEAVDLLERAIRLYEDDRMPARDRAPHYHNLAMMFNQQGDYEQALKACRRVVELDPSFLYSYYFIGLFQSELNNCKEAEASYRKFLEVAGPFHGPNQDFAVEAATAAFYIYRSMHLRFNKKVQASHALGVLDVIQEEAQEESKELVALLNMAIRLDPRDDDDSLKEWLKTHLALMEELF